MEPNRIQRITVIGAGLMGHGIAQEFALAGFEVALFSRTDEGARQAIANIRANLERLTELGIVRPDQADAAPMRVRPTREFDAAVGDADLVIEAVPENLALKQELFERLDAVSPEGAILASTTSTYMPSQLATATHRPERVVVTHYFNPPYLVPLVEIVRGEATSDDVLSAVQSLLRQIGKRPVVVQKEVPGFIGNRLQAALLREALWMVQRGVATPEDVDTVIKNSIGRRWAVAGVFEIFDLGGWDVVTSAASSIIADLESSSELPQVALERVEKGELGVKTGKGFYEWTPESADALRRRLTQALVRIEQWS